MLPRTPYTQLTERGFLPRHMPDFIYAIYFFTEKLCYLLRTQGDRHLISSLSRRGCVWKALSQKTRAFTPWIWARPLLGQGASGISSKHNISISFATAWPKNVSMSFYLTILHSHFQCTKAGLLKIKMKQILVLSLQIICAYSCMCLLTYVYVFFKHLPRREGVGSK